MILKYPFEEGGLLERPGVDTQYFGKDAEDFLESINWHSDIEYLDKECIDENDFDSYAIANMIDRHSSCLTAEEWEVYEDLKEDY